MTGEEKAALLLKSLDPELSGRVLMHVGPPHLERLRAQLAQEGDEDPKTINEVLVEFDSLLEKIDGALALARQAGIARDESPPAAKPEGKPEGKPKLEPVVIDEHADPMEALPKVGVDRLALALQDEQVRTVCLVLNLLDAQMAGEVLKRLPPPLRRDASLLFSVGVAAPDIVVQRIAQALLRKCQQVTERPVSDSNEAGRYKKTSDMLRLLPKPERMEILATMEEQDPVTAAAVKEYLYQFDDLLRIDDRSMQKVLGEIDSRSLGVALKGASEPIQQKILGNLSKRARETLAEEMEFLGNVPTAQIQQAQKMVVEIIQRLDQLGELVMLDD
jgi:flagellar motor switch protein FliG